MSTTRPVVPPSPGSTASRRRRGAGVTASVLVLLGLTSTAAAADPPVTEHNRGTASHVEQDIGECLSVPFPIGHAARYNARYQEFRRGADGLQYVSFRLSSTDTITNLDTGVSLRSTTVLREKDVRITDEGDGTLSIVVLLIGTTTYHEPSGALIGVDATKRTLEVVVDHAGTPDDWGDDVVLSEALSDPVGASTLGGASLCDIALEYLG